VAVYTSYINSNKKPFLNTSFEELGCMSGKSGIPVLVGLEKAYNNIARCVI
jgi:hypothetical protein